MTRFTAVEDKGIVEQRSISNGILGLRHLLEKAIEAFRKKAVVFRPIQITIFFLCSVRKRMVTRQAVVSDVLPTEIVGEDQDDVGFGLNFLLGREHLVGFKLIEEHERQKAGG